MTVNAVERENVWLATDNRRLRLENAALIKALEEIEQTADSAPWAPDFVRRIVQRTFKLLPGVNE